MPSTHTRLFRIRRYECDAYSHLNNVNYLRFMQEAAFDASAAVGYDMARYEEINRLWIIRETEIEYLAPVYYNDVLAVKTWVADFRRATSSRAYEFYNQASGALVARASTLWVYINASTSMPAAIPHDMALAFVPELADVSLADIYSYGESRPPYPKPPAPPVRLFTTRHQVTFREIDQLQHVNNAHYLEYVEECGIQVLKAFNWSVRRMADEGLAMLLRKSHIQYLKPALLDDELEIVTWAYDLRRSTARRYFQIRRASDGELLVQVHVLGVWTKLPDARPARIPTQFLQDFAENISSD